MKKSYKVTEEELKQAFIKHKKLPNNSIIEIVGEPYTIGFR